MTFDWNNSAKFENGRHRSHGLAAILENGYHKSHGVADILEKHPKHLFSHYSYALPHPHPPLRGPVCKYCALDSFIICDMTSSLQAGQS